jgi:hypothetical protein
LSPSITNTQAQIYDFDYGNDHYRAYPDQKRGSDVNIQKLKCVDSNINVNGLEITEIPQDATTWAAANEAEERTGEAANTQNGNGLDKINFDKNLVNICLNINFNEQVKINPTDGDEPGTGPETCEECFEDNINPKTLENFLGYLSVVDWGILLISAMH